MRIINKKYLLIILLGGIILTGVIILKPKEKDSSATAEVINLINIPYEIEKYKGGTILGVSLTNTEINNKATVIVPIA